MMSPARTGDVEKTKTQTWLDGTSPNSISIEIILQLLFVCGIFNVQWCVGMMLGFFNDILINNGFI